MGEKLQLIKGVIFGKAEDDFPSTLLFFFFWINSLFRHRLISV